MVLRQTIEAHASDFHPRLGWFCAHGVKKVFLRVIKASAEVKGRGLACASCLSVSDIRVKSSLAWVLVFDEVHRCTVSSAWSSGLNGVQMAVQRFLLM